MNRYLSPIRNYRKHIKTKNELCFQVILEETDLFIVAEKKLELPILEYVSYLRKQIKTYIELHPEFLTSLIPLPLDSKAPLIVQNMLIAAQKFQVGPMAAVAGAIAEQVATKFVAHSPNLIVENGGDIYIYSQKSRTIGLLAHPNQNISLGLKLDASQFPCALCTSSGKIGHSLNFGQGDIVVVMAKSGADADAAATALSNLLKTKKDISPILKKAQELSPLGVKGLFLQLDETIGAWGELELITF
ncbi:hypothetical protein SAMN04488516_103158 [Desulfonauticus submarinus]|uniref:Uncharacterized protein n=1 Tax=Desulfonauticus submarinus TaxID=206665 RepID=A0A1H0CRH7_9BACT|nr:UPF0280 family protein [Desulfonauticus submarinus]SDN60478.1 hypothetical protein SAMN04488516_103158 [Desulfonauticus submarinus]